VGKHQGSRLQGPRDTSLQASSDQGPDAASADASTKAEPAQSDSRSEQTGIVDARLSRASVGTEDSRPTHVPAAGPALLTLGALDTAKDGPAVSEAVSSGSALVHVSASTAGHTDALSMQESQRSGGGGGGGDAAAAPSAGAASAPAAHNRFCPPHGAKAICGRRARMEDAYTAVPFLLEVPMPGTGLPLEVRFLQAAMQSSISCAGTLLSVHALFRVQADNGKVSMSLTQFSRAHARNVGFVPAIGGGWYMTVMLVQGLWETGNDPGMWPRERG